MYHNNPEEMTPDERDTEAAEILAAGFLRLKKRAPHLIAQACNGHMSAKSLHNLPGKESGQFTEKGLDFPADQSVHGDGS